MNDETNQTQDGARAQAAAYVESLAALLENPATPADVQKSIADIAADLLTDSEGDMAALLRYNAPRLTEWLVSHDEATGDTSAPPVPDEIAPFIGAVCDFILDTPDDGRTAQEKMQAIFDKAKRSPQAAREMAERAGKVSGITGNAEPQRAATPGERYMAERIAAMIARFEKYKGEVIGDFQTGEYIYRILALRDEFDNPAQFRREMIAFALSLVLEFDETPAGLYDAICAQIASLHSEADIHNHTKPENVREFFGLALQAIADEEAEQDEATADSKAALTEQQANDIGEAVAYLMSLPLPTALHNAFSGALSDCESLTNVVPDTSADPDLIRGWLPKFVREQARKDAKQQESN